MGIVPIANPFSTAPLFISMTAKFDKSERQKTALLACLYMCALLLVFLFLGMFILQFFGISLISLRLAGGLVILYMGFRMLFPPEGAGSETQNQAFTDASSVAFTPLALPMLSGPGSISVVLAMAAEIAQQESVVTKFAGYAVVSTGIVISSLICWTVLSSSGAGVRVMGEKGIDAMTKLMGFILICIGVEFLLKGWLMAQTLS
jgi:multiple antibiotic resistance protein